MLTIIFAKTAAMEPAQFIGPTHSPNVIIKQVKSYGQIHDDTVFAALVETPNGHIPQELHRQFELIKIHPARLRGSTPRPTPPCRNWRRSLQRHRRNQRKCTLSERSWKKFVKRKHLLCAYREFNNGDATLHSVY